MLKAVITDLVFTISVKRSTQIFSYLQWPADYPVFTGRNDQKRTDAKCRELPYILPRRQ
jgi:hypothetical protein